MVALGDADDVVGGRGVLMSPMIGLVSGADAVSRDDGVLGIAVAAALLRTVDDETTFRVNAIFNKHTATNYFLQTTLNAHTHSLVCDARFRRSLRERRAIRNEVVR